MCLFRVSCFYWVYAQFLKIQISTNDEVGLLFLTWPHTQRLRYSWTLESAKPMSYLNGLVVFSIFFNLSLNLAIRSSWSEPQPQLPPGLVFADSIELLHLWLKNIINLVLVLTIWWCPCAELSLVLLEEGVCYDKCVLLAKLCYPLTCFILYSKTKFTCYSRYLLTSHFCVPVPYNEKDIFFEC